MNKMIGSTTNNQTTWLDRHGDKLVGPFFILVIICGIILLRNYHLEKEASAKYYTVYNILLKGGTFFDNDYYTYNYHYENDTLVFRNIQRGVNMRVPKDAVISITEQQWKE